VVRHPIVLFLEDDLVASEEMVSGHVNRHRSHDRLVVAGYSPIVAPRESPESLIASLYAQEYEHECTRWETGQADVLTGLYGGHVSLRTDRAREIRLVNPDFDEHYHEDRDFGLRCLQAGMVGCFDRGLLAWHHYERDVRSFEHGAERLGAGTVRIHQLHRDILGEFDPTTLWNSLPASARLAVRLGRRVRTRWMIRAALHAYLGWARGSSRSNSQILALRLLRRISQVEGARRALRTTPSPEGVTGARHAPMPRVP
jgi:hypothetical protein